MLTILRTNAFRTFQRHVGNSTFHINSAYIGLELIARGADKPADLKIKWTPPKSPQSMVAQSRSFLHMAFLGHLFSALDSYLRDMAADQTLRVTEDARRVLSKAVTKPGGSSYSMKERFAQLAAPDDHEVLADQALVGVVALWRNQTVHDDSDGPDTRSRLDSAAAFQLAAFQTRFAEKYGGLDVQLLVDHIRAGRTPSRKEMIALASAAQNYVRWIDGTVLRQTFAVPSDVVELAVRRCREALLQPDDNALRQLWGKDIEARVRRLKAILQEAGFTEGSEEMPRLPENFIWEIASSDVMSAKRTFAA